MTDLPYTYTDVDGDRLAVFGADIPGKGKGVNVRTDPNGCSVPTEDAPDLARAVLAAAGDTGHEVTNIKDYARAWSVLIESAARSMRERIADAMEVEYGLLAARMVETMPLLPDGDTNDTQLPGPVSDASRMLSEIRDRVDQDVRSGRTLAQEELDRERLLGMVDHLRAKHAETHATSMRRGEQLTRAEAHLKRLTGSAGRSVEPLAEKAARLEAEAARLPNLVELRELVERLAIGQAETTKAVTKRLAVVEGRLGITDDDRLSADIGQLQADIKHIKESSTPARYRDRDGDLWERVDPFLYVLISGEDTPDAIFARPLKYVRDTYGPLTPVTTDNPPAPCEVCGRAPDEQEHGPNGQCRHTPATRLGRPTT